MSAPSAGAGASQAAEVLVRAEELQAEAAGLLTALDLPGVFSDVGPVAVAGSHASGLIVWRHLDVMLSAGPAFSPGDVVGPMQRVAAIPRVTGFVYRDERGERCATGQPRGQRSPDEVGGLDISTAVLDDGIRTAAEFVRWLAGRAP